MAGKRLVVFGAGMTGRGQVAQLAFEDGWRLTFVDRDERIVTLLREAGRYTVRLLSAAPREVTIDGFAVLHTSDDAAIAEAVTSANLVVTSVLEPNLPDVGRTLAAALAARLRSGVDSSLNVVAAENMNSSSTVLGEHTRRALPEDVRDKAAGLVGFPNSMIARVVPVAEDPLYISAEEDSEWTADRTALVGDAPDLAGLEWVDNQTARLQRKLYIHNTGHAVCGYFGWLAGHRYIHEAAQNPNIMRRISAAIAESGEAVSREHGFSRDSVRAYEENLKERLVIDALPDDIRRVIRQPIRKLGKEERLLGPMILCEKFGLPREALCRAVAALLCSRMPGDEQFERIATGVARLGLIDSLRELVDYIPAIDTAELLVQAYSEVVTGA
jgi:mannitol-1-phosphate 5-dehydrogenase